MEGRRISTCWRNPPYLYLRAGDWLARRIAHYSLQQRARRLWVQQWACGENRQNQEGYRIGSVHVANSLQHIPMWRARLSEYSGAGGAPVNSSAPILSRI